MTELKPVTDEVKISLLANAMIESNVLAISDLDLPKPLKVELCYKIRTYAGWYQHAAKEFYSSKVELTDSIKCQGCED